MHTTIYETDTALLQAMNDGDNPAFTQVYDRFYQRLYFFALRFVESADAKDAVSEAFVKLWHKRDSFKAMPAVSHFLFLTVRNRCLDLIRHQHIRQDKQAEMIQSLETMDETDLFHEQVKSELIRLIYHEVEKLPTRMREVFLLSFAHGLKPAEIAEKLQISVQTVSNQKLSAIRLLQAALGDQASLLSLLMLLSADSLVKGYV